MSTSLKVLAEAYRASRDRTFLNKLEDHKVTEKRADRLGKERDSLRDARDLAEKSASDYYKQLKAANSELASSRSNVASATEGLSTSPQLAEKKATHFEERFLEQVEELVSSKEEVKAKSAAELEVRGALEVLRREHEELKESVGGMTGEKEQAEAALAAEKKEKEAAQEALRLMTEEKEAMVVKVNGLTADLASKSDELQDLTTRQALSSMPGPNISS